MRTLARSIDTEFAAIVAALTRRQLLGGLAGGAALVGLAACDTDGPASPPASSGTRTVDTAYGPVEVPLSPTRVVCVDTYTVCALLDVGVTPVGVGDGGADLMLASYRDTYAGISKVASADQEIDLEAVAALAPDLILGVDYPYVSQVREHLAAIAPTAVFTWNTSGDWEAMVASATAAVGQADAETDLEARYHQRAAELRTSYADLLARTRVDLVTAGGGQAYVWLPASGVAMVLADAGIQLGAASTGTGVQASGDDLAVGFKALSFEQLDTLADATLIITSAGADGQPDADATAMMAEATFARLPAAQAAHIAALVNFFPFSYGQALAALDELQSILDRNQ